MTRAVIISDMLRGFLEEGYPLFCGQSSRSIIPNVQKLLEKELSLGSTLFYLCDRHSSDDPEFAMFPPHCIEGTIQAEIIPELAHYPGKIIPKKTYSLYYETTLDQELKKLKPETIVICGVCTHICILYGVADSRIRGYDVEVPADCVATFDEKAHLWALDYMKNVLGARLTRITTGQLSERRFEIPASVLSGDTADIYFARTIEILKKEGINPIATMEVFPRCPGILCGIEEVKSLLEHVLPRDRSEVWALAEGESFQAKEVALRITAPYQNYGLYETAYLGMLSQCSGWATAARECVNSAGGKPVISFGARHVHPTVAGIMDYAAITGGCTACSSVAGAKLTGIHPSGTMPHSLILVIGDTARATLLFDKHMPPDVPRISLVDTFKDEPEESVLVARAMEGRLQGVRLDTPSERGGVTIDLIKETRARLDLAGFSEIKILVSGGLNPQRIRQMVDAGAPVDYFGVGSYISDAQPVDFTADLHEIDGKPVAKRGRIPGITPNPRLKRII